MSTLKGTFMKAFAVAALFGLLSSQAAAAAIYGSVSWSSGTWTPIGADVATATAADFPVNTANVDSVSGDYGSTLSVGDLLIIGDLDFSNATQFVWSGGGFSFDSTSLDIIAQTSSTITIEGLGVASGSGFDDTDGDWNVTLDSSGSGTDASFSFSGSSSVSEPGILGLMGLSLMGLGLARRKRAKRV